MAAAAGVGPGAGAGETGVDNDVGELAASFTRSLLERSTPFPIPSEKKNRLAELGAEVKRAKALQTTWITSARGDTAIDAWRIQMTSAETATAEEHTAAVKLATKARAEFAKQHGLRSQSLPQQIRTYEM
jgi:hypothetical protein